MVEFLRFSTSSILDQSNVSIDMFRMLQWRRFRLFSFGASAFAGPFFIWPPPCSMFAYGRRGFVVESARRFVEKREVAFRPTCSCTTWIWESWGQPTVNGLPCPSSSDGPLWCWDSRVTAHAGEELETVTEWPPGSFCGSGSWGGWQVVQRSQDLRPSVGQGPHQVGTATHTAPCRASVEVAVVRDHFLCGGHIVCCVFVGWRGGHGSDGLALLSHEVECEQDDSVENYTDLFTIALRNDDIQEFDSKWDGILLSMTKIPHDDILEELYKLRIRESEKLKTDLELYDLEIHQKKLGPDYHRLKIVVKRSIEQEIRNKNFGARSGNFEKNAVFKNQGTKQRVQRILGDCWRWGTNGQCERRQLQLPPRCGQAWKKFTIKSVSEFFHAAEWAKTIEDPR